MVGADPEAGGIEAVKAPNPAAQSAALHAKKVSFRQALPAELFRLSQNRFPDSGSILAVAGAQKHGAAIDGLKAAAKGGINQPFLIEPEVQL